MKVLCFAPYSAIWVHALPEALVADAMQRESHQIIYVTCGKLFEKGCIAMSAFRVDNFTMERKRQAVCNICTKNKELLKNHFNFNGYDLSQKLGDEDKRAVQRILQLVKHENVADFVLDGIQIGRLSLYEFLLKHKKSSLEFTATNEWNEYLVGLENALFSFYAGKRILDEECPDRIIVYNSLYSTNRIICELARSRNVPFYFLHAGGNLAYRTQTLMLGQEHTFAFLKNAISHWQRYKDVPCPQHLMKKVTDHFIELVKGRSVFAYSKGKGRNINIRDYFNIKKNQRIMVATMSSYDERFAAEIVGALCDNHKIVFPRQIDWIEALVEYVRIRPELFLLIRVHPREFANKREGVKSEHAIILEEIFRVLPDNVRVNWPGDGISLYDLADEADVVLNAWSSVGKEMALLGIPVVIYSPELIFYPPDLNYVGRTLREYFAQIDQALKDGWDIEWSRKAYRWCSLEFNTATIDLSKSYDQPENHTLHLYRKVFKRLVREVFPCFWQKRDLKKVTGPLASQGLIIRTILNKALSVLDAATEPVSLCVTKEQETVFLKRELARLSKALYRRSGTGSTSSTLRVRLSEFTFH